MEPLSDVVHYLLVDNLCCGKTVVWFLGARRHSWLPQVMQRYKTLFDFTVAGVSGRKSQPLTWQRMPCSLSVCRYPIRDLP